jgi:hypothetical protein
LESASFSWAKRLLIGVDGSPLNPDAILGNNFKINLGTGDGFVGIVDNPTTEVIAIVNYLTDDYLGLSASLVFTQIV